MHSPRRSLRGSSAFTRTTSRRCFASSKGFPTACSTSEPSGVEFIDDSKATNVGAAVASIDGLAGSSGKIVLIAGGVDHHDARGLFAGEPQEARAHAAVEGEVLVVDAALVRAAVVVA